MASANARDPSPQTTFKFPAFQPDLMPTPEEDFGRSSSRSPSPSPSSAPTWNGHVAPADRWQPRRDSRLGVAHGAAPGSATRAGHSRQKSLGEALRTIRTRKASVSQNAHEIADALKAPVSPRIIVCHRRERHEEC
jgi:solute carrier family 35 protein E1